MNTADDNLMVTSIDGFFGAAIKKGSRTTQHWIAAFTFLPVDAFKTIFN